MARYTVTADVWQSTRRMVRWRGWMDGCVIEGSIDMQMARRIDGEMAAGS